MFKRIVSFILCLMLVCTLIPGAWATDYMDYDVYEDEVAYYVVPYVIQMGDSLADVYQRWGLRFEKYADLIRAINWVDNLDVLEVDTIYYLPTTFENLTEENLQTNNYVTVVSHIMRRGETAYQIYTDYGIDYNANILRLRSFNGFADLAKLSLGDKLYIPIVSE